VSATRIEATTPELSPPASHAAVHARRIGIASAIWGVSILLSRVIGLGREAVLGRTLGAGTEADLYATAFVVPDFLNYLLAGGALSIVFIPIFGAYLARGEEERASEAFSVVANFLCVLLAAMTVALWVAMPALVPIVAPGFTPDQQAELVLLSRIVLPAQVFHVVGGLLSASMQARDKHALPALAPLVYTLGIIAGGLIGGAGAGAFGFAWGALAGSILGPFLLPLVGAIKSGLRWRRRLSLRHPDLKTYLVRSLPIMIGFSIIVVDDWYLRREGTIAGTGAAATLSYAKSLMKVPMGVFGLAAGVAVFPTLLRLVAGGDTPAMRDVLVRSLRNLIVIAFLAQAVLSTCGADIVTLVYGRSKLDAAQVHEIAACLTLISIGLSAWAAQSLIARGFYALGNTWMPALLGTAVAVVAYPLYVLAREQWSVRGLAVASSCAIVAYTLLLAWRLDRRLARSGPPRESLTPFFARALVALCAAIGAGKLVAELLPTPGSTPSVAAHGAVIALSVIGAFALAGWLIGMTEVRSLGRLVTRRTA
jgi:putative peptidoglycan lipid II flippase